MKNSFPTLDQIKEALRDEGKTIIAAFDRDVKLLEAKVNNLEERVDKGFTEVKSEMNQRFNENDEAHQEILKTIGELTDIKITKHYQEQHPFATL